MVVLLTVESISQRCSDDIDKFCKLYSFNKLQIPENFKLTTVSPQMEVTTFDSLKAITDITVQYINTRLNGKNYVDEIKNITDPSVQQLLWIARTYLFYQMLIFTVWFLSNKNLYNIVYAAIGGIPNRLLFTFRDDDNDIIPELKNFHIGIFGSITPTSDIDVGIQYSGTTLTTPGLAYIVGNFETFFVAFTDKVIGSLAYDIETYADMITIPHVDVDGKIVDYFYLDSSEFDETHFEKMLTCAGKSIARNMILSHMDREHKMPDIETIMGIKLQTIFPEYTFDKTIDDVKDQKWATTETKWFDDAKSVMYEFLQLSYNKQRFSYYEKVYACEKEKFKLIPNPLNIGVIDTDAICNLMVLVGDALAYRMESYTCVPTITHIVRILQANKDNKKKYENADVVILCDKKLKNLDPFCSIGKYGYLLSLLEQIGYLYRFDNLYCQGGQENPHFDFKSCDKKDSKYYIRYNDTIKYYLKYKQLEGPVEPEEPVEPVEPPLPEGIEEPPEEPPEGGSKYKLRKSIRKKIRKTKSKLNPKRKTKRKLKRKSRKNINK